MSAALVILPVVWATEAVYSVRNGKVREIHPVHEFVEPRQTPHQLGFYRKYTEGLLRRYLRLSMETGKVPSLMGKEMFRAKVTHYVVHGFDDMVIFVHDMEKCLAKLTDGKRLLVERIALQEYTQLEAAQMLGLKPRTLVRRYEDAIDALTQILLDRKLLLPMVECKGVGSGR